MVLRWVKRVREKFFLKFLFGIVGILLTGYGFSGILYYRQLNNTIETQGAEQVKSAYRQVENSLGSFVERYELIVQNIYSTQAVNAFLNSIYPYKFDYGVFQNVREISTMFDNLKTNGMEINRMMMITMNPELVIDGVSIIRSRDYLSPEVIDMVISAKGGNIWLSFKDKESGKNELALLKYLNAGKPGGILVVEFDETYLFSLIRLDETSKHSVYILDREGTAVSSNNRDAVGKTLSGELEAFSASGNEQFERLTVDGSPKYVYSKGLEDIFHIIIMYDINSIMRDNRKAIAVQILLLAAVLLVMMLFVFMFGKTFDGHIRSITDKIKKIHNGKMNLIGTVRSRDEFEYMDASLCEMAGNIDTLNRKVVDAVNQKTELELRFLQMQIKPHFLYNSLSSIRWLSIQRNQMELSNLLEHLIQFYKITLSRGNDIVPIREEIELVQSYVALQNLIYKDQILLDIYICESLTDLSINKMTLQPFVENSILHGKEQNEPIHIWVSIEELNDSIKISVEDDGKGINPDVLNALGESDGNLSVYKNYGILSTIARLRMLFGHAEISISSKGRGTIVDVLVPIRRELS